jgi:hypothetical protein
MFEKHHSQDVLKFQPSIRHVLLGLRRFLVMGMRHETLGWMKCGTSRGTQVWYDLVMIILGQL